MSHQAKPCGQSPATGGPCDCQEAYEHLLEYLDSTLNSTSADRIRAHIESCESCSSDAITSEIVRKLLRRCCIEQAPSELRVRIVQRLRIIDEA
ncbi:mycothiol system anti-sigma-R factor [Rarobacter incanus]|uniref:Mycothiol system anti-sigma-R factor n=1 Tax=Rarobacter incanus TaxID=153494 RepID=A0A542SRC5_9MICO|nr:mycothiol system anti-sigma-R factor [Rarobacter incanus]TQK77162.1 mycothiol system anti-sigma-R factor [Rarobacter incanus]